jgi:hypothetical protein
MPVTARHGYRVRHTVLREQDVAAAEIIAQTLKGEGWTHANRSYVTRAAIVYLTDALRGKAPQDVVRFFVERIRRQQPQRPASAPPQNRVVG